MTFKPNLPQTNSPNPAPTPETVLQSTVEKAADSLNSPPGDGVEFDATPDFDAIQIGAIAGEVTGEGDDVIGDVIGAPEPSPGQVSEAEKFISKDDFFGNFRGLIGAPNGVLMMKGQDPLASLVIADDDAAARNASDAIYETCEGVTWLQFIIGVETSWAKRIMAIGFFFFGLASAVKLEINARSAAPAAEPGPSLAEQQATAQPVGDASGTAAPVDERGAETDAVHTAEAA